MKSEVDLGQVSYSSFFEHEKEILSQGDIRYLGVPTDALTFVVFNRFSKLKWDLPTRLWIRSKLQNQINVNSHLSRFAQKTSQYFPPESQAYNPQFEINVELPKPASAPNEIVIHTYATSFHVTIEKLVRRLEGTTGLKVKVLNDINPPDAKKLLKEGKIDLFLTIMSTDFRMPAEAINFEYFSPDARLVDASGNIKTLFEKYQLTTDALEEASLLRGISQQMILDAQLIPLFHAAIPFFYNEERINLKGLSHLFIQNFWKLKKND